MGKIFFILPFFLLLFANAEKAEAQGVSFSFFFPNNGEMAAPVPPVALRGLGLKFGDHIGLSTGITWYRITGMGVKGVPFEQKNSVMGTMDNFMIPAKLNIIIPLGHTELRFSGGAFTYFNTRFDIRRSRLERALAQHYGRDLLKGNFHKSNKMGFGWTAGATYTYFYKGEIGIKFGANYLSGSSDLDLHGSYRSVPKGGGPIEREEFSFPDSELDYRGWEFSIGIVVKQE